MSGKTLAGPGGGDDLTALLRSRHVQTEVPPTFQAGAAPEPRPTVPAPAAAEPDVAESVEPKRAKAQAVTRAEMDRRSWYMPKTSADALADLVEELHWETRRPKHEILAALVDVALAGRDKVARKLSH